MEGAAGVGVGVEGAVGVGVVGGLGAGEPLVVVPRGLSGVAELPFFADEGALLVRPLGRADVIKRWKTA